MKLPESALTKRLTPYVLMDVPTMPWTEELPKTGVEPLCRERRVAVHLGEKVEQPARSRTGRRLHAVDRGGQLAVQACELDVVGPAGLRRGDRHT